MGRNPFWKDNSSYFFESCVFSIYVLNFESILISGSKAEPMSIFHIYLIKRLLCTENSVVFFMYKSSLNQHTMFNIGQPSSNYNHAS